jgi:hypothetical protein
MVISIDKINLTRISEYHVQLIKPIRSITFTLNRPYMFREKSSIKILRANGANATEDDSCDSYDTKKIPTPNGIGIRF